MVNGWVRRFLSKANYEAKLHNFSGVFTGRLCASIHI